MSTKFPGQDRYSRIRAGRRHHLGHLAKVGVAGSNPVVRSKDLAGQGAFQVPCSVSGSRPWSQNGHAVVTNIPD